MHKLPYATKSPKQPRTWTQSNAAWAMVSIFSFPIVAVSLASLGWKSYLAFIMACLAMLAILFLEAMVSGHVWIFHERYRHIFDHRETPFRILVVAGGVLLLLETFLILELFQNSAMDGFFLNLIARKQCANPHTSAAQVVCPFFVRPTDNQGRQQFALLHSLETATLKHLTPSSLAGSCAIIPLTVPSIDPALDIQFFAYCQTWQAQTCRAVKTGESALITSHLIKNDQGFYAPTTWQEDKQSTHYVNLVHDTDFLQYLDQVLERRCLNLTQQPIKPPNLK